MAAEVIQCPNCSQLNTDRRITCKSCGINLHEAVLDYEKKVGPILKSIILTTTPYIEGYKIIETIDIVSSECVFGLNVFKDFSTGLSDFFGGRSETAQKALKDAKSVCLNELRKEALSLNANAVIGVDLDYSEFSGQGKSMLFLVANGTAVRIEKISNQNPAT